MRLKSLPPNAKVYEVFARRPEIFEPFTVACEKVMRGPSALEPGVRELLGAYVSRLNSCPYCHDVHNEAVKAYGIDAVGFNALDVPLVAAPRTYSRELLSRVRAVVDANLFRRQPRHLGDSIVIGPDTSTAGR